MGRLVVGLGLTGVLVILAVQNISPMLTLVVLGAPTLTLPFSAWLLGSVAVGVLLTLLISTLLDRATGSPRRPYRPLGQRIRLGKRSNPRSGTNSSPNAKAADRNRPDKSTAKTSKKGTNKASEEDVDWDDYRAPSQWEDWGQRPEPGSRVAPEEQPRQGFRFRPDPYAAETTMGDIESGWDGYDDYGPTNTPQPGYEAGYGESGYDQGYDRTYEQGYDQTYDDAPYDRRPYDDSGYGDPGYGDSGYGNPGYGDQQAYPTADPNQAQGWENNPPPQPRVHPDGYLYGDEGYRDEGYEQDRYEDTRDRTGHPASDSDPEDVYDADFRVIIPPYNPDQATPGRATDSREDNSPDPK